MYEAKVTGCFESYTKHQNTQMQCSHHSEFFNVSAGGM